MRLMRARRLLALLIVFAALAGAGLIARPYVHGLSFVVRAAEMQGAPRRIADLDTTRVTDDLVADYSSRGPTWYDTFVKPDVVAPDRKSVV